MSMEWGNMGDNQESSSTQVDKPKGPEFSKKAKLLTAAAIFYGNITFGCALNTYGPVITSIQNKYEVTDSTISKTFTILTTCYMVGALSAGLVYKFINRQLGVIGLLLTITAMMVLTPFCPTLTTFFVTVAIMGYCCGLYEAAELVWIMEMMQKDCPPYVMCQNFFYAVGSNLATLIMAPFLDEEEDDPVTTTTPGTSLVSMIGDDVMDFRSRLKASGGSGSDSKLFVPYLIVGFLVTTSALSQILLFVFMRYFPPPPEELETAEGYVAKDKTEENNGEVILEKPKALIGSWSWPKLRLVILCCCVFGAYQGMEMCTFQFFSKFAQNSELKLTESEAAYVLTGTTASFAVGRAIAIVAVFKIATQLIICGNIGLCLVANILLIGWATNSLPVLWTSGILFGLGFSSFYGAFTAFIERYLLFTDFMGGLLIVCGSGVAAIYPLVIANSIENNPIVLSYTTFFSIGLLVVAFSSISYLTHKNKTRY